MGDIISHVATVQTNAEGSVNVAGASGETGEVNMDAEKTIKDILGERQEQLKDLE